MLTIFNRKELCISRSIESQAEIRDILQNNGIEYTFKIIDHNNYYGNEIATRAAYKSREILYRFYVHKKNYDVALFLIQKIKR